MTRFAEEFLKPFGGIPRPHRSDGVVLDFTGRLRRRPPPDREIDLIAAWEGRRVQLLREASDLAREILAAGEALSEAAERFRALGSSALTHLHQIDRQVEDIDVAIAHLRGRSDPVG